MTTNEGLREPRSTTTPTRWPAPAVALTATVALALTAGCSLSEQTTDRVVPEPAAVAPASDQTATLPWASAMVARNGTDITVYGGPGDARCKELWQPRTTITEQDAGQVVIAVQAKIVTAADCAASGGAVPLVVSLPEPLGGRALRDAATGSAPPIYFERDLPDLSSDKRWSPFSSQWMSNDEGWHQGYNGPGGSVLLLTAQRTAPVAPPAAVATFTIGTRRGTITGREGRSWTVWWAVGAVTYSLRLEPPEGGTSTLKQFKQEIASLRWS